MRRSELCSPPHFATWPLGLALASPLAAAAPSPMQPGLWELRVDDAPSTRKTTPTEVTRECLTQKDIDDVTKTLPRPDGQVLDCPTSQTQRQRARPTTSRARATLVPTAGAWKSSSARPNYDGMADMKVSAPGKTERPSRSSINAKRIGDCSK